MMRAVLAALAGLALCSADEECGAVHIVESLPYGTDLAPAGTTTFEAWMQLIDTAQHTVDIAACYVTLTQGAGFPAAAGGEQGQRVYDGLREAHARGVRIRLALNEPSESMPDVDAAALAAEGVIDLRILNWAEFEPSGILHTKLLVADAQTAYVGSANLDWRALTQVKELGVFVEACGPVAGDMQRIFETYWLAGASQGIPTPWPEAVAAVGNLTRPIEVAVDGGGGGEVFLAASPPDFAAINRTDDLTALLAGIHSARERVSVEVMDYFPTTLYMEPNVYWPAIDTALRDAAYRGVQVRLLAGVWNHTAPEMYPYLASLDQLANVAVRAMHIPDQGGFAPAPYSRVNHAKFMVTENEVYVGTSNWSGDYFEATSGVSCNWRSPALVDQMSHVFDRDWGSKYTRDLD